MSWHKTDQEEILAEGRPRPRRGRVRLIVALAVVGAAAWYFLRPSPPPSEVAQEAQEPQAPQAERGVAPIRRDGPQAGAPAPDEAGSQRSGERARALIAELKSDPAAGISRAYAQAEAPGTTAG